VARAAVALLVLDVEAVVGRRRVAAVEVPTLLEDKENRATQAAEDEKGDRDDGHEGRSGEGKAGAGGVHDGRGGGVEREKRGEMD